MPFAHLPGAAHKPTAAIGGGVSLRKTRGGGGARWLHVEVQKGDGADFDKLSLSKLTWSIAKII